MRRGAAVLRAVLPLASDPSPTRQQADIQEPRPCNLAIMADGGREFIDRFIQAVGHDTAETEGQRTRHGTGISAD